VLLPERLLGLFGGLTTIRSKVFGLLVIPAAIEAVEGDSGYSVLIEGHRSKEGKFKVVSADEEGVIGRATRWLNGNQMFNEDYEDLFAMDFNGINQIGF